MKILVKNRGRKNKDTEEKGRNMWGIINIYLFWGAWVDLRKKAISNLYLWLGGMAGIVYNFIKMLTGEFVLEERFMAILPGIFMLAIAKITNEKIGYGDGWVILILGSFLKFSEIYRLLQFAVILAAVVSVSFIIVKKAGREYKMPFLPFLWIAYICQWGIKYV